MRDKSVKAFDRDVFIALIFLCIASLFLKRGAYNLSHNVLLLFSFYTFFKYFNSIKKIFLEFRIFYIFVALYLLFYVASQAINFEFLGSDFIYALKKERWLFYLIFFIPSSCIYFEKDNKNLLKKSKVLLGFLAIIAFFVAVDTYTRYILNYSLVAKFLALDSSAYYSGARASWLFNPNLFCKISVFSAAVLFLVYTFFQVGFLKKLSIFLSVFYLGVAFLTQSRAAWLGLLIVLPIFIYFSDLNRKKVVAFFSILVGVIVLFSFSRPDNFIIKRIQTIEQKNNFSNNYRLEHWKANLKLSRVYPIWGVGYGANKRKEVISPYLKKITNKESLLYDHPHNEYLDVLSGSGYPSLFFFLGVLLYPLFLSLGVLKKKGQVLIKVSLSFLAFYYIAIFFDMATLLGWSMVTASISAVFVFYRRNKSVGLK